MDTADINHQGEDLRGASFRGEDLSGADFSDADLRGADFSEATLVGTSFCGAKLGVRPMFGVVVLIGALVVSIAAGFSIGLLAEATRERMMSSDWRDVLGGVLLIVTTASFVATLAISGVRLAIRVFVIVVPIVIALDLAVVYVATGELRIGHGLPVIGLLLLFAPAMIAGVLGRIVGGAFGKWSIAVVALIGGLAAGRVNGGAAAVALSLLLVLISRRAMALDKRDGPLLHLAQRVVTRRGTNFSGANLTEADLRGTTLALSNTSNAILVDVNRDPGMGPTGSPPVST